MPEQSTGKTCDFPGCGRKQSVFGLCKPHRRQKKNGDPLTPLPEKKKMSPPGTVNKCAANGCLNRAHARGYCQGHYKQFAQGKEIGEIKWRKRKGSPPVLICDEVPCLNRKLGTPCHVVRKAPVSAGYVLIKVYGRDVLAHRYVWQQENGDIPDDLMIDHQCRVRACCNVDHLRLVTLQVNNTENCEGMVWQLQANKTHCDHGHPFDEKNTRIRIRDGRKTRVCRQCKREEGRRNRRRKKELPCLF